MTEPPLVEVEPGHLMSCHIPLEELGRLQKRAAERRETLVTPPSPDATPDEPGAVAGGEAPATPPPA